MQFRFLNRKLEALYATEAGARKYPEGVVAAFFEVMAVIDAAVDERDLRQMKSLHLEALKGQRTGKHSVRLNRQYRLILAFEEDRSGNVVLVIDIEDYH